MTGEVVQHVRYGRGVVTRFEPPYIDVAFESEAPRVRRFAYPGAVGRFLSFLNDGAAAQAARDLDRAGESRQLEMMAKIEANRRREEQMTALRLELQRKKRADMARRAAERRKTAMVQREAKME